MPRVTRKVNFAQRADAGDRERWERREAQAQTHCNPGVLVVERLRGTREPSTQHGLVA